MEGKEEGRAWGREVGTQVWRTVWYPRLSSHQTRSSLWGLSAPCSRSEKLGRGLLSAAVAPSDPFVGAALSGLAGLSLAGGYFSSSCTP